MTEEHHLHQEKWLEVGMRFACLGISIRPWPNKQKMLCWHRLETHAQCGCKPAPPVCITGSPGDCCWRTPMATCNRDNSAAVFEILFHYFQVSVMFSWLLPVTSAVWIVMSKVHSLGIKEEWLTLQKVGDAIWKMHKGCLSGNHIKPLSVFTAYF